MSDISDAMATPQAGTHDFGDDAGVTGAGGGRFRGQTATLRDQATEKLRSFADEGKLQVTNSLDGLIDVARELANKIGEHGGPLGGYASSAADTLEDWASTIKDKSVEDLIDDGREFARRSPAVAVGIAVAAGFVLSRLLKSGDGRYAT